MVKSIEREVSIVFLLFVKRSSNENKASHCLKCILLGDGKQFD